MRWEEIASIPRYTADIFLPYNDISTKNNITKYLLL